VWYGFCVFYGSRVMWVNRLFVGTGTFVFINSVENGVMNFYTSSSTSTLHFL
jgi:hypothetical protein